MLKVSYIGFRTKLVPVQLSANATDKKLGTITLDPDAVMLKEAVITAEAPQVVVKEDTLEYNSTAYRTPEGAMLEELVKKLPGAEIDDDGNVKINGKEVKKIMVDGKEFFGGDVKTGLKNLPVNMIDKLKTYDKKSDLARVTGIDDGEEETVLDLKVKKGMTRTPITWTCSRVARTKSPKPIRGGRSIMYTVMVTGGIGSGKSKLVELLCERGAVSIDLDEINRRLISSNTMLIDELAERFGEEILDEDGAVVPSSACSFFIIIK